MLRVGLLLLIVPPLLVMAGYLMEQASVDACLDRGGVWHYLDSACLQSGKPPFVPYMQRHPLFVNGGMLLAVLGFVFCLSGLYRRR